MSKDSKSSYYDVGGIEVFDVQKAKLTPEQFTGYLMGNVIKYSLRANHKGTFDRDIEKIAVYAGMLNLEASESVSETPTPEIEAHVKEHVFSHKDMKAMLENRSALIAEALESLSERVQAWEHQRDDVPLGSLAWITRDLSILIKDIRA